MVKSLIKMSIAVAIGKVLFLWRIIQRNTKNLFFRLIAYP